MWGRLKSRYPPFESRIKTHGLRAGEDLSSLIEENILEKRRWIKFLICVFGGEVRVEETCCSSYEKAS